MYKKDTVIEYLEQNPGEHRVRELTRELNVSEQWVQQCLKLLVEDAGWLVERLGKGKATKWRIEKKVDTSTRAV